MSLNTAPDGDEPVLIDGRYRVEGMLGEGGMGAVYAVVELASGQSQALKRLAPGASAAATALFQREYHTLCQLQHPCIVRALEFGVDGLGPYYTMERLGGADLRKVAPLPWRESCAVLSDVASALALVHSRRLLHRDVNHKNVRYIEGERARLLDFGALSSFGVAAERVGMAPFMSPEAYHGQPLGPRSDLFALGGIAYWLLTGRHAYDARGLSELPVLWRRALPSPSVLGVPLPGALDALVMQLLSLQVLGRPGSAAEVMDRVAEIADFARPEPHQAARSYLANPRLVGRARELERVDRVLRLGLQPPRPVHASTARTGGFAPVTLRNTSRVRRSGPLLGRGASDASLWVSGDAGLGRSRLLHELALQAKLQGARVAWVSADALSGRPHSSLRALVEALLSQEPELIELFDSARRGLLDRLLPRDGNSQPPAGDLHAFAEDQRPRLHAAVVDWLLRIAERRGLVVLVDDAHRADDDSVAFFGALAASADGGRVVLVSSTRGTAAPSRGLSAMCERASKLALEPLDSLATQELIDSLFGSAANSRRLAAWAYRVSGGNPLHCMQVVNHLVDAGLARYDHGVWSLPEDPQAHALPDELREIYAAQVANLSPVALDLGRMLALQKRPTAVEDMLRFSRADSDATLFGALAELTDAAVVDSDGKAYRTAHQHIVEALVGQLSDAERAALHGRVAEALLAAAPHELEERFEVAYHLLNAGAHSQAMDLISELVRHTELVPAIGPHIGGVLERALQLCEATGRPGGDAVRIRLALVISGSFYDPAMLRHVDAVHMQLREASGVARAFEVDPSLSHGERMRVALDERLRRFKVGGASDASLHPFEALTLLSTLLLYLVHVYARRVDAAAVAALLPTAEMIGGLGGLAELVHQNLLAAVENLTGYDARAHQRFSHVIEELDRVLERGAPAATVAPVVRWRATLYGVVGSSALYGDPDQCLEWAELSERAGMLIAAWRVRYLAALMRMDHELIERSEAQLDALVPASLNGWEHGGWFLFTQGSILNLLGDAVGLKAFIDAVQVIAAEHPGYADWLSLCRGLLAALRGENPLAERTLRATIERDPTRQGSPARQALVALARVLSSEQRHAEALELCDAHAARMQSGEVFGIERSAYLCVRALALGGLGRTAEAREFIEQALREADGYCDLLRFQCLFDAAMLGVSIRDAALLHDAGEAVQSIASRSGMPGLTVRYAALNAAARKAGLHPSVPPS